MFKNECQGTVLIFVADGRFHSEMDFAANGHFCNPFCSYEMRVEGCEMALVCQGVVLQL